MKSLLSIFSFLKEKGLLFNEYAVDLPVDSIEYDSRRCSKGSLFFAVSGFKSNGEDYIESAVEKGISGLVLASDSKFDISGLKGKIGIIFVKDIRKALALVSFFFFDNPDKEMTVIGITGTNGKTTVAHIICSILEHLGHAAGVIGTIGYKYGSKSGELSVTTPESRDLAGIFNDMKLSGIKFVVMEVSSHSLSLDRVYGIDFDIGVFTNLSQDHLDFHDDMESYFDEKLKLFKILSALKKRSIVNIDDPFGKRIYDFLHERSADVISYSVTADNSLNQNKNSYDFYPDYIIRGFSLHLNRTEFTLEHKGKSFTASSLLPGKFNLYNLAACIAVADSVTDSIEMIISGVEDLHSVPGRFEIIPAGESIAIVDYAHTPDALEKILMNVNEIAHDRLITVFGCGGDRDKRKRPLMGRIAADISDHVIVTSDNPRTEDPDEIINNIVKGISSDNFEIIADREEAIKKAMKLSSGKDIILIAGKGHEDYQILGDNKIHFDDREMVRKYRNL